MSYKKYKELLNKKEAQKYIKSGINKATDLISPTLGVKGNRVFIDREFGDIEGSDDGITILKEIELEDTREQLGVKILKEASAKTNDKEGDGTTTTAVIANELINQIIEDDEDVIMIDGGRDIVKIKNGFKSGFDKVIKFINKHKIDITSDNQIANIAKISSNSEEVGNMLMEIFKKLGKDAVVNVESSDSTETTHEITEGMSFERGYISEAFMTNPDKEEAVLENPKVLVTDYRIQDIDDIQVIIDLLKHKVNDLLIIADDVNGIPLRTLIINKLRGNIRTVAVKSPGFGNQTDYLKDIATLTGATLISNSNQLAIKDIKPEHLGKAIKVVVNKTSTVIIGGEGKKEDIDARILALKNRIEDETSEYEKSKLKERVGKMANGVCTIKVGGVTGMEAKDRNAKVEDAVNAVKSALKDGIVAGGGIALMRASIVLDDKDPGEAILKEAIVKPFEQILINANVDSGAITARVVLGDNVNQGYDVSNDKIGDMVEMGIIDPAGVVKTALENALSIAKMVLTGCGALTLIREKKEEDINKLGLD